METMREKQWIMIIIISTLAVLALLIIYGLTLAPHGSSESEENLPLIPKYILSYVTIVIVIALVPLFYLLINMGLRKNHEETMKILIKSLNENSSDNKDANPDCKTIFLNFLNFHEKQVIKKLIEQKGHVLQSDISRMNNMGKVKAHRAVRDLQRKGVINIEKYGNTNRIILNQELKKILKI